MRTIIRQQAELLGFEVTDDDLDAIIEKYFFSLHRNGEPYIPGVRGALRRYFK